MGKTQTIEDKEAADKKFREFMAKLEQEAQAEETLVLERVQALVTSHYKENGWNHGRLFGDRRSDYQNYDDWGLERIAAIIKSIGDALADVAYPSKEVPGSDDADQKDIDTAKEFAGAFTGDYTLIIKRVTALMSGVLTQFSSKASATMQRDLRDIPLSGGLHLFFGASGKVYEEQSFFAHQFIASFQIIFEAHVSVEEAKAVALQQILKTTEYEIAELNKDIIKARDFQSETLRKLMHDPDEWLKTKASFGTMLAALRAERAELVAEYDKYKSVTDAVDTYMDMLDLTAYGRPAPRGEAMSLDHLFIDEWENQLAQRYIAEKLAS